MIYLDYASTVPVLEPQVINIIIKGLREYGGNPSNNYELGKKSKDKLEECRTTIAKAIEVEPDEIFFTSGASEGNAWALAQGVKCICSAYEHHNITNNNKSIIADEDYIFRFDKTGWSVGSYLKQQYKNYVYSHMLVNNETGEIFNVAPLFEQAKNIGLFTHCDMTQALGNIKLNIKDLALDMATFTGHKVGAPKGIGFVYINKETQKERKITPLIYGGIQEKELRAGTENLPYIMALSYCVHNAQKKAYNKQLWCSKLREIVINKLEDSGIDYLLNEGESGRNLMSTINFSLKNITGEIIADILSEKYKIYVGTGSACNTGDLEPSEVLKAMHVPEEYINGALRLSFSEKTTTNEIEIAMEAIINEYKKIME